MKSLRLVTILLVLIPGCSSGETGREAEVSGDTLEPESILPVVDLSTLAGPLREAAEADQEAALSAPEDPDLVGRLGMRYLSHDFPGAAAVCFSRAAGLDPLSMDWKYGEGLAREVAGQIPEAIAAYERAMELDPGYGPVRVRLGMLLLEEDPAHAAGLFQEALEINPDDPSAWFGLGQAARLEGDRETALAGFRRAVELFPEYAEAHYAIAMILSARGLREEAARHLEAHAAGGPLPLDSDPFRAEIARMGESAASLRDQAERFARNGDVDEAVALLTKAIERDVSGSTSHVHLGLILAREGRFEEAAAEFRTALAARPDNIEARSSLGLALTELGQIEEARSLFNEVLQTHPDHAATLVYLGRLELRAGRTREGIALLRRGVEAQPANPLYQLTLGEQLARAGREGDARPHLERAVSLSPDNLRARHMLALVLARIGWFPAARENWLAVLELQPDHADALLGLAGVALQEGESEQAVGYAERACELTGYSRPRFLSTLADAYQAAGRDADARKIRARIPR